MNPLGAAIIIEAKHECMGCRGVKKSHATMTTSAMSHFDLEPFDQEPASISLLRPGNTQSTLIIVPTNQSSHRGFACQLTLDNASANITFDSEL